MLLAFLDLVLSAQTNLVLNTTDRSSYKTIRLNNLGATESLSMISLGTTGANNYRGHISFSTKGTNDLFNLIYYSIGLIQPSKSEGESGSVEMAKSWKIVDDR